MAQGMTVVEKADPKIAALEAQIAELKALVGAKVSDAGIAAVQLLADRSAPKENPNYNEVSPFTYPEGERVRPKPKLARPTFFAGARCRDEDLTPAEIDAFNSITQTRLSREGTWKAEIRQNGSAQELWIDVPVKTLDDRMNLPSLAAILLELHGGEKAADPLALAQRVAELEAKLASVA